MGAYVGESNSRSGVAMKKVGGRTTSNGLFDSDISIGIIIEIAGLVS